MKKNAVFIATSLDGYIADKDGGIDWLHSIPNPEGNDMGYGHFMSTIDALILGRNTFETVLSFGINWPYEKPVFVLSNSLKVIPEELKGKVSIVRGELTNILKEIHEKGFLKLYIDGGQTINSFLRADLIDELIITRIPTLLGGGTPLFKEFDQALNFSHTATKVYLGEVVQSQYIRKRGN